MEITTALQSDVPTIPILVGGADFDLIHGLPEDIQRLADYLAVILRDANWDHDIQTLLAVLRDFRAKGSTQSHDSRGTPQATAAPPRTRTTPSDADTDRRPRNQAPTSPNDSESSEASPDSVEEGAARDIFISYVEEDGTVASELAKALHAQQRSTWTYEEDGVPGVSYLTQVFRAIDACRAVVLIASAKSVKARQVIKEIEAAHERDKMLIAVRVGMTHQELTAANEILRMAIGTAVTLPLDQKNVAGTAKRIARAIPPAS